MKYIIAILILPLYTSLVAQNVLKIKSNNGVSKITYILSRSSDKGKIDLLVSSQSLGVTEYSFSKEDVTLYYEETPPFVTIQCNSANCIEETGRTDAKVISKQAFPILLTRNQSKNKTLFKKIKTFISAGRDDYTIAKEPPARITKKTIPLNKMPSGTYGITLTLNGVHNDEFILDSGASLVCINPIVFRQLYINGTIREHDFLDAVYLKIADGSTVENLLINLKSVKIGEYTFRNIQCVVADSPSAPLLLGQNILQAFGTISIDYENNMLYIID